MRCRDIMKRAVECVSPEDTVQWAAEKMRQGNVGFLPVCEVSNKVLGTITDRDLTVRILADARAAGTAIRDVMTKELVACSPEDSVRTAEELMAKHHKSRIVCLDGEGKLAGIISLSDVAQAVWAGRAGRTLRRISAREARP